MAHQCGFDWRGVLRLFKESFQASGGSGDEQGFDFSRHETEEAGLETGLPARLPAPLIRSVIRELHVDAEIGGAQEGDDFLK